MMDDVREEWRPVPRFGDLYEVSSLGRIRRINYVRPRTRTRGHIPDPILKEKNYDGYSVVLLFSDVGKTSARVHRVVAFAFCGPPPFRYAVVRHLNGIATDNRAANLAWGSTADNNEDTRRHGRAATGAKNVRGKLKADDVLGIRRLLAEGRSMALIAKSYGVCYETIRAIKRRKTWTWLTDLQEAENV